MAKKMRKIEEETKSKSNKGLYMAIIIGMVLAAYPIYGYPISSALWTNGTGLLSSETTKVITGNVVSVGSDYIVVNGETIIFKGYWDYNGKTLYYTAILALVHVGDRVKITYTENQKWGKLATEIVLADGSVATKEVS